MPMDESPSVPLVAIDVDEDVVVVVTDADVAIAGRLLHCC
jgi:hypothetical protein